MEGSGEAGRGRKVGEENREGEEGEEAVREEDGRQGVEVGGRLCVSEPSVAFFPCFSTTGRWTGVGILIFILYHDSKQVFSLGLHSAFPSLGKRLPFPSGTATLLSLCLKKKLYLILQTLVTGLVLCPGNGEAA